MTGHAHCIATVCLGGTLTDKLEAAAAAGFGAVEIFDTDLAASKMPPAEVRRRCADLGLAVEHYQPFRDLDSTDPDRFAASLRQLDHALDVASALGTELVLVCSSVAPDAVPDGDRLAEQLALAASRAAARGRRLAYEALAWGTHVYTYPHAWDAVRRADHPSLGLCLDSFHHFARGGVPSGVRDIPGDKLFMLQLADATSPSADLRRWSRHHRLLPGHGEWDLAGLLRYVLATGYTGPLSLEVFNDELRRADPRRTAVAARRALSTLHSSLADPARTPAREVR